MFDKNAQSSLFVDEKCINFLFWLLFFSDVPRVSRLKPEAILGL